ncbi:hypothetical protein V3C99_011087, partial [Haemonchus contortus]
SDDTYLTFQASGYGVDCDQVYRLELSRPTETLSRISTGVGTSAGSSAPFLPSSMDILYSGNFHRTKIDAKKLTDDASCTLRKCDSPDVQKDEILRKMCRSRYVWDVFPDYDIFKVNEYGNILDQLTNNSVYDSEASISPDGKKVVYTSKQSGDLDLWIMDIDGTNKEQLTTEKGYDGGASFSPDGKKIVFHATRPKTKNEIEIYDHLLENDLVAISEMGLYVMNTDGTDKCPLFKQPHFGLNWTPYYHPDNKRIIFSSNTNSTKPSEFHLYIVNDDGTGLEQVTFGDGHLNAYPVFSHDGKKLVWSSNRGATGSEGLNLYIADWVDSGRNADDKNDAKEELRRNRVPEKQKNTVRWQDTETTLYDNIVHYTGERRLKNVKQLTFRGQNAEGYFSYDDSKLTLQASGYGTTCDQLDGTARMADITNTCPPKKCANRTSIEDPVLRQLCNTTYTWDIFSNYDIFMVNKYGNIIKQLTDEPGYDAEGVLSPDGNTIAFTSIRSGDLELWTMNTDGTNLKQVTNQLGYDGGSFFSPDGKRLVFRSSRPKTQEEVAKYKKLLDYHLVEPTQTEIYVVDVDGTNLKQLTNFGVASWAPYFLPDNKRIIFSSNYNMSKTERGSFALYAINDDGTGLERITFGEGYQFNSFPMFNRAGTKLVWGSSRNRTKGASMNLFIADWIDEVDGGGSATSAPVHTIFLISFLMLILH